MLSNTPYDQKAQKVRHLLKANVAEEFYPDMTTLTIPLFDKLKRELSCYNPMKSLRTEEETNRASRTNLINFLSSEMRSLVN